MAQPITLDAARGPAPIRNIRDGDNDDDDDDDDDCDDGPSFRHPRPRRKTAAARLFSGRPRPPGGEAFLLGPGAVLKTVWDERGDEP